MLCAAPAAAQGVASFDSAWAIVQRSHFDSTFNGVDWNGVRAELRPRAEAAPTPAALRGVIQEMLGRLHQSHFYLIPAEASAAVTSGGAAAEGDAGLDVRLLDGRLLVTRVRPGGPAAAAGVRAGWTLERVGERDLAPLLAAVRALPGDPRFGEMQAWGAARSALTGPVGGTLPLTLRDGRGRRVVRRPVLAPAPGEVTRFGNLPPLRVRLDTSWISVGARRVGVIGFNYWLPALAAPLDEAVNRMRGADGIVLDLRGNPGGAGAMAMGVAGHFIDRPDTLGTMRMRTATLRFVVNPRRVTARGERVRPYAGPVAILTDATTASTSEVFASGMQRLGRARVFGAPSAGQALPAYMDRLPSGDVLVHAIADYTAPGGVRLEGTGVVPDVPVVTTRAGLLAGHDDVLEAALAWIAGERGP